MSEGHPSIEQLRAFVQGRLTGEELRGIETHLETCATCLEALEEQPDSKLLGLARQAATQGFRDAPTHSPKPEAKIPPELRDHPRYDVQGQLGRGGMGAVYRAEHRIMQRPVALKIVHPSLLAHPHAVQRFRREVRVAAKLSHPNIVTAYDADQAGDLHFLVMEFVDGVSLDQWIKRSGRASIEQACDWIRQAALGLQHAHERGMAHRDIKPHNLMLTNEGTLKILDFGLTRLVAEQSGGGETQGLPSTTREGVILGTPDYIAPEQIVDAGSADIRADIYSLGCTLYHLLAGRPPFKGRTIIEKLHAHGSLELPPLDEFRPEIPPPLLTVIARMTAKNPADRYPTPADVAEALEPFLPSLSRGSRSGEPLPPPVSGAYSFLSVAGEPPVSRPRLAAEVDERELEGPVDAGLSTITSHTPVPLLTRPASPRASSTVRQPARGGRPAPRAVLIGGGIAALLLLMIAGGWQFGLFGGGENRIEPPGPVPPPVTTPHTPRLLLLLPSRGLWFTDYRMLVDAVHNSRMRSGQAVQMVVAGTSRNAAELRPDSTPGTAIPDIQIDASVTSDPYDALIFIGFDTSEFDPGGDAADHAARLIRDFQSKDKIVASLCAGQRSLAKHGALRGRNVATCPFVSTGEVSEGGGRQVDRRVVRDGLVVTGAADRDAADFVDMILQTLADNRSSPR